MSVIKVENLVVKYGDLCAISDISFEVLEGEAFGIIGKNGAGKTTLVETMEGLRKKTSGHISIKGIDPSDNSRRSELYSMIAVQLQSTNYPDKAKVEDLCKLFSSICDNPVDYKQLLEQFDLSEKINKPVNSLSGGQKQKLSILLALISHPKIIFLDELTTGLDADARHELWKSLKDLKKQGVTIILVSHYMDDIEMICDRIGIMQKGKFINIGTKSELIKASGLSRRITFTCDNNVIPILNKLDGVIDIDFLADQYTVIVNSEDTVKKCLETLDKNKIKYTNYIASPPTLEDAFLHLINENNGGESHA